MRKLLSSPVTYIIGAILFLGGIFLAPKTADGFTRFARRTQKKHDTIEQELFVKKTVIDDIVMGIIHTHAAIDAGRIGIAGLPSSDDGDGNLVSFFTNAQKVASTDIVSYLEHASDKKAALATLLAQLTYYEEKGSVYTQQTQETIARATQEYTTCANAKTEADSMFYQGLREGDQALMQQGISDAQQYASCQANQRVLINAQQAILTRMTATMQVTRKTASLLRDNQDAIVAHFPLFKDSYLEELFSLRQSLRQYTTTSEN